MKRIILFSVFASLLVFTGCKKENISNNYTKQPTIQYQKNATIGSIPFATEEELEHFASFDDIVHYKIARYYA